MAKIKLILTEEEADMLYQLVSESTNTGNDDWDKTMHQVENKLHKEIQKT